MSRDTQFQGFAKAVVEELTSLELEYMGVTIDNLSTMSRYYREEWEKIIARRVYDFEAHTVGHALEYLHECGREIPGDMKTRIVPSIPDMIELPTTKGARIVCTTQPYL